MRPRDEALEPLDGGRRGRDEPRDFLAAEQRQQRPGVAEPQLAERDAAARQHRQRAPPVRGDRLVEREDL